MPNIEWCRDLPRLFAEADTWNGLSRGVPFRETNWLCSWWTIHQKALRGRTLVARDDAGRVAGILPLYEHSEGSGRGILRNLADGDACSDYVSISAREDQKHQIANEMADFLIEQASVDSSTWKNLVIDGVVEGDDCMETFTRRLQQGGCQIHFQSRMHTWFRACEADWDQYLGTFSRGSRSKQRRLLKQLDEGSALIREEPRTVDDVRRLLDQLIDVHQRRWQNAGQPGSFDDPRSREFVHTVAESAFRDGSLWLVGIRHGKQLASAAFSLIGGDDRAYCYSTATDLDRPDLQAGKILTLDLLRHAHDRGLRGIDFLRGDEEYKRRLHATPRKQMEIRVAAPDLASRIKHAAWLTQFEVKQFLRRRLGRKTADVVTLA